MTSRIDRQALGIDKIGVLRASLVRGFGVWTNLANTGKVVHLTPAQAQEVAEYFAAMTAHLDAAATLLDVAMAPLPPAPRPGDDAPTRAAQGLRLATRNGEPL